MRKYFRCEEAAGGDCPRLGLRCKSIDYDEPTSCLSQGEYCDIVRDLKADGVTIILSAIKWKKFSRSAIRDHRSAGTASISKRRRRANITVDELIELMVGRKEPMKLMKSGK